MADRSLESLALPLEVRARLAELELELSEGDITQKGYEKKRSKLIGAYLPQPPGVDQALPQERRTPVTPSSSSRYHRRRSSGSRDERYRSDSIPVCEFCGQGSIFWNPRPWRFQCRDISEKSRRTLDADAEADPAACSPFPWTAKEDFWALAQDSQP